MDSRAHQPQPLDYMRQASALRSYTTPAVITLALYFLFWIPGLVTNVIYLIAANDDRRKSGLEPQGRGCLIALLAVFVALPIFGCVGLFGFGLIGGIGQGIAQGIAATATIRH